MCKAVEVGEVVGQMPCDSCGAEIDIKVNKKGGLCAVCTHPVKPEAAGNKKYCWHRVTFSPYAVAEIIKNHLEDKGLQQHVEQDQESGETAAEHGSAGSADINAGGDAGSEAPAPRGKTTFLGGVGHFFTGDE